MLGPGSHFTVRIILKHFFFMELLKAESTLHCVVVLTASSAEDFNYLIHFDFVLIYSRIKYIYLYVSKNRGAVTSIYNMSY